MGFLKAKKTVQFPEEGAVSEEIPKKELTEEELAHIEAIRDGFEIKEMRMADATPGRPVQVLWVDDEWEGFVTHQERHTAVIPAQLFSASFVQREMTFKSVAEMHNFRIHQRVKMMGQEIEHWYFEFGFVIPNSVNTWQNVIEAAGEGKMIPPQMLHNNLEIETIFCEGESVICKSTVGIQIAELVG